MPAAKSVLDPPKGHAAAWTMPRPRVPLVQWHHADFSGTAYTAIVTAVYKDTIDVMVFPNGVSLPQPRTGCRHKDDPTLATRTEPNPGGVFELAQIEFDIMRIAGPPED